jgi:hypothetical protein
LKELSAIYGIDEFYTGLYTWVTTPYNISLIPEIPESLLELQGMTEPFFAFCKESHQLSEKHGAKYLDVLQLESAWARKMITKFEELTGKMIQSQINPAIPSHENEEAIRVLFRKGLRHLLSDVRVPPSYRLS